MEGVTLWKAIVRRLQRGGPVISRILGATLIAALSLQVGVAASARDGGERFRRCGAVPLDERPRLNQKDTFDGAPYQRRHNTYMKHHADVFGSAYIAGDHWYVNFTKNVCKHLEKYREGLPQPWRVRAVKVNHTYGELLAALRCIRTKFEQRDLGMQGNGDDVWRNKIEVMFKNNTQWRHERVKAACGTVHIRFTEGTVAPS